MSEHNRFCVSLTDIHPGNYSLVGSKAANLVRLSKAGFPIPHGYVVTCDAYLEAVRQVSSETELLEGSTNALSSPHHLEQKLRKYNLPDPLVEEILAEFRMLSTDGCGSTAVRSSSSAEDLGDFSFSGI